MIGRNRNIMNKMLHIFLSTFICISIFTVSEGVLQCRQRGCVFCHCWNQSQLPQTLQCDDNHIIRLEFYEQRRMRYSYNLGDGCKEINNEKFSCFNIRSQSTLVDFEGKLEIYQKCNAKRTCDVKFPTKRPVKVQIPYLCEPEALVQNISTRFAQNGEKFPIFHFEGKEYTKGQILNCECNIEIPEPQTVLIEVFFINLGPEACNRVIISNKNISLFSCTDNGLQIMYGPQGNIAGDMRIQIKDLMVEGDEVLYFKLRGNEWAYTEESPLSINCTGCSVKSGLPENSTFADPPVVTESDEPSMNLSEGVLQCRNTDCVLCQCWDQSQLPQTLQCDDNHIIRLEFFEQRRMRYSYNLGEGCKEINNEKFSCFNILSQSTLVDFEGKLGIYQKCNAKRTCDVTFPTKRPVKVQIPYVCEPEAFLRKISTRFAQNGVKFPIFHFEGKEYTKGQILNCECNIEIPEPQTVLIEVFFINLGPEACDRVIISNKNISLFSCTDNGLQIMYGPQGNIAGDMRIQIKDLMVEGDEVLYFKLRGDYFEDSFVSINCTGCSVQSGPREEPFMNYIILASVLGVLVVIIGTVTVCVFCCLRKRKQQRLQNNRPYEQNGEENYDHYDYVDDNTCPSNNIKDYSGSHGYLDLTNSVDGYLVPQVPAVVYYTNGSSIAENERLDQRPLSPRTSTESCSYNRSVIPM